MKKLDILAGEVGGKVVDYVQEALREYAQKADAERNANLLEIANMNARMDAIKQRLAELEADFNGSREDDKYALTKAKLIRIMKDNGWYD